MTYPYRDFLGFVLGVLSVAAVAYAEHMDMSSMSGILLGVNAFGALVGGLVFEARQWPGSARQRMLWLLGALAIFYLPLVFVRPPVVLSARIGLAGVFFSPVLACGFVIIGQVAPWGTITETFAWMVSIIGTGAAGGSAIVGSVERFGLPTVFALPIVTVLCSMLVAALSRTSRRSEVVRI